MALSAGTRSGVAIICRLVSNPLSSVWLFQRSHDTVAAENLFLSRQIALYKERGVKPRRAHPETRLKFTLNLNHFD
jgi:cation diffusion facilitator CzcD-associated flavoprotein CzcO